MDADAGSAGDKSGIFTDGSVFLKTDVITNMYVLIAWHGLIC